MSIPPVYCYGSSDFEQQYTLNALCYLTKTITRLGTLGSFAKGLINQGIESTKIELPSFIQTYETTFLITTNNSFTGSVL